MPNGRSVEGEREVLAEVIIGRRVTALNRAILYGIEHLRARHKFPGGEDLNLKFVVAEFTDRPREILAADRRWGNGPRSAFQASRARYGAVGWRASRGWPGRRAVVPHIDGVTESEG